MGGQAPPTVPQRLWGKSPELLARGKSRLRQLPVSTLPGPRKPPQIRSVLTLRFSEWASDLGQGGAAQGGGS